MASRGEWLTRQMERRGVSVRQLADAMDVATQTVYNWQSDKTVINEERVPRLAAALSVSEIEARRALGFWVPDESAGEMPSDDRLDAVEEMLEAALAEINRLKRDREKPA